MAQASLSWLRQFTFKGGVIFVKKNDGGIAVGNALERSVYITFGGKSNQNRGRGES